MLALRNSLFDDFFTDWLAPSNLSRSGAPLADIYMGDDKLVLEMELPGLGPDNVDISVDKNILTVKGEKIHNVKHKEYLRVERYQGKFSRSFTLPSYVDSSSISASYEKGILKIEVPKKEDIKPKKIPIKTIE